MPTGGGSSLLLYMESSFCCSWIRLDSSVNENDPSDAISDFSVSNFRNSTVHACKDIHFDGYSTRSEKTNSRKIRDGSYFQENSLQGMLFY